MNLEMRFLRSKTLTKILKCLAFENGTVTSLDPDSHVTIYLPWRYSHVTFRQRDENCQRCRREFHFVCSLSLYMRMMMIYKSDFYKIQLWIIKTSAPEHDIASADPAQTEMTTTTTTKDIQTVEQVQLRIPATSPWSGLNLLLTVFTYCCAIFF